jgi:formylglycine-generating enzyme required for sulfatase activity
MKHTLFCILFLLALPLSFAFGGESPSNMVLIKGGCFTMGTNKVRFFEQGMENYTERPAHKVCVDDFYLDKFEIAQMEWEQVIGEHNSHFTGPDLPVDNIKWDQAVRYCAKLGKRLPYEAEWEYAAKAGSQDRAPWNDASNDDYIWYARNSGRLPHPIGTKKPNPWGVHDLMGSVWEWVNDWYSIDYYTHSPTHNPKGPETTQSWHVIRGLSWVDQKDEYHVTTRFNGNSDRTYHFFVGGRCAKSVISKNAPAAAHVEPSKSKLP